MKITLVHPITNVFLELILDWHLTNVLSDNSKLLKFKERHLKCITCYVLYSFNKNDQLCGKVSQPPFSIIIDFVLFLTLSL